MRRLPATVRFRVTALATAVVIVVLVGVGLALVLNQRRTLTESLDEAMVGRVNEIAEQLGRGATPSLENLGEDDSVAQIVGADGRVIASSRLIDGADPIGPTITRGQVIHGRDELTGIDGPVRVLSRVVDTPDGSVTVHFAASRDDIDESVRTLFTGLMLAVPVAAAVLATIVWIAVGRALRPVEEIRAEVASIGGSALDRRVPVPGTDDEIGRLALTMNEMLERLDDASRRQRQFVADASHELRSPLTRMRSELEVDIAHPDSADPAATHHSVLEEVVGLQHLVDDLLLLARNGALDRRGVAHREPVSVHALITRTVQRTAAYDVVTVSVEADSGLELIANEGELSRAIRNVVDNAFRHARSAVRIAASSSSAPVVITVEDDGPGIPAGQHERIFERFTRVDEGRSATDGGFGLGLAIARDIVERHGGTLVADPTFSGGARFVMTIPPVS